jgi:HlyD family secretion protein
VPRIKISLFTVLYLCLLVGCSREHHETLQGYIEGRFNYLASNYSGALVKLFVSRGTQVKAGQTLAILDPEPQKAALDQANENLLQAEAQYEQTKTNLALTAVTLARNQALMKKDVIAQETLDTARTNQDATQAQLRAALANLAAMKAASAQARWAYAQKTIVAPLDGEIFDNYYEVGDLVPANYPILGLLSPNNVSVIFFIPEPWLSRIKIGDPVQFFCDSKNKCLCAKIQFISPNAEYTPPVIYSQRSREKLVYRVEAKVPSDVTQYLHPGQPVGVDLTIR